MTRSKVIGYWAYEIYSVEEVTKVYFGRYTGELPGSTSLQMGFGTFPRQLEKPSRVQ